MSVFLSKHRQWGIQAIFWLGFFFLFSFFWSGRMELGDALLRGGVLTLFEMAVVYVNLAFLVPKHIPAGRYGFYVLLALLLVAFAVVLYTYVDHLLVRDFWQEARPWRRQRPEGMGPPPGNSLDLLDPFFRRRERSFASLALASRVMFHTVLTLAVVTISTAYAFLQIAAKREKEAAILKSEKLDAEMKFLRSQINPHFLFNALNNAYTLAYIKSEQAPEVILKLSDILRYIIYDCKAEKVPLDKEVQYIRNYIDLQKIKAGEKANISADIDLKAGNLTIEPMLFIPFIENSFKHSHIEDEQKGWIRIKLVADEREIRFEVENSLPEMPYTKDKVGGIGLENVQKRLELLYPNRHKLMIWAEDTSFRVLLEISRQA